MPDRTSTTRGRGEESMAERRERQAAREVAEWEAAFRAADADARRARDAITTTE